MSPNPLPRESWLSHDMGIPTTTIEGRFLPKMHLKLSQHPQLINFLDGLLFLLPHSSLKCCNLIVYPTGALLTPCLINRRTILSHKLLQNRKKTCKSLQGDAFELSISKHNIYKSHLNDKVYSN